MSRTTVTIQTETHEVLAGAAFALGRNIGEAADEAIQEWAKKHERAISDALQKRILKPAASRE